MKKTLLISAVIVSLFSIYIFLREPITLSDHYRNSLNSSFVKLDDGFTEYLDEVADEQVDNEKPDGEIILLIHGFSIPMFIWDPVAERLTKAGFRVVRYNQYGRGASDRVDTAYNRDLSMRQINSLLDSLNIESAHIVGHSMGGAVAANFSANYPQRAITTTLISPMLDKVTDNGGVSICRTPVIGCYLTNLLVANIIYKRSETLITPIKDVPTQEWLNNMKKQAKIKGFRKSLTNIFHTDLLEDYSDVYKKLGEREENILLITSGKDCSIPQEHFVKIKQMLPNNTHLFYENSGHQVNLDEVDSVTSSIINFINSRVVDDVENLNSLQE